MKKYFTWYFGCALLTLVPFHAKAKNLSEAEFVKYIPDYLKTDSNGEFLSYGKGIGLRQIEANLDGQRDSTFLILEFSTDEKCDIQVLKEDRHGLQKMDTTVLKYPTALDGCSFMELKDLDQDGKPELIVETVNGRSVGSPVILKWDGRKLVDISPTSTVDGETNRTFRAVNISDKPILGRLVIFDYDPVHEDAARSVYAMKNGQIVLEGTYDVVSYIGASKVTVNKGKFEVQDAAVINHPFPAEAQYTLTVKNVSDHNRAVRAEVTVNGSVVLKPQDFCSTPPPKKTDKKWWTGNDDDDDRDDDHCKRCVPKNEAYAIVNMKTANEIKVKVYGRKDSKIQLTLVKK